MIYSAAGQEVCSPRTRGWSVAVHDEQDAEAVLPAHAGWSAPVPRSIAGRCALPAHAGVVPRSSSSRSACSSAPCARGGGPFPVSPVVSASTCSPRTRGWSAFGAHRATAPRVLSRARGGGPSARPRARTLKVRSPRTRGWSRQLARVGRWRVVPHACSEARSAPGSPVGRTSACDFVAARPASAVIRSQPRPMVRPVRTDSCQCRSGGIGAAG
jgi:hypothetical protein